MGECTLCPLNTSALTVCVPGRGKAGGIMLVGAFPSAQDDLAGETFSDESGTLLRSLIIEAGLDPRDCYVTNAVKCRVPRAPSPSTASLDACRYWLKKEIHETKPTVIVALGDVALRSLCKAGGLSGKRGQAQPLHDTFGYACDVWPTYNPAYVLRVPQARSSIVGDLTRMRTRFDADVGVDWRWGTDLDGSGDASPVAWDVETSFYEDGTDTVTQVAWSSARGTFVSRAPGAVLPVVTTPGRVLVTHNGWKADVPWMHGMGFQVPWGDDTIVLAYLDDETQPLGLEALCVKYLGVRGWKEGIHAEQGSDEFALYNARDADYTRRLYECLSARLGPRKRIADKIIFPAFLALRECTERGIYISREAVERADQHYSTLIARAKSRLDDMAEGQSTFNPASPKQVSAFLSGRGIRLPLSRRGQPKTDVATLSRLPQTPEVVALRDFRKASKAYNAFVKPYRAILDSPDGRAHPDYKLWRTATGRTASSGPNVQQLGRELLLRSFFSAPRGRELWSVDYAQIEFRLAAFIADERSILERFRANPDWDPHSWFAARLYGVSLGDVTPAQRQVAKSANFGLLYMAGADTLREYAWKTAGIDLTLAEAEHIRTEWHRAFPRFGEWYGRTADLLRRTGYVESLTGRRRHFGAAGSLRGPAWRAAWRESVNHQVQSLAADVALLGLAACHEAALPINGFFHDAVTFEFPEGTYNAGNASEIAGQVHRCLTIFPVRTLAREFGVVIDVPLTVDVKLVQPI